MSEAPLRPGCQPLRALFTPTVSTKTHKTGDLAVATREKWTNKIIGAAAPARDHGGSIVGGCDAKSETAPRGDLNVVVGPTTTQERRGWTNDYKRGRGRASRQAHVAQKSQRPQPGGREAPDDHESARRWGMQCQVRRRHRATAVHDPEAFSRGYGKSFRIMGGPPVGPPFRHDHDRGGRAGRGAGRASGDGATPGGRAGPAGERVDVSTTGVFTPVLRTR